MWFPRGRHWNNLRLFLCILHAIFFGRTYWFFFPPLISKGHSRDRTAAVPPSPRRPAAGLPRLEGRYAGYPKPRILEGSQRAKGIIDIGPGLGNGNCETVAWELNAAGPSISCLGKLLERWSTRMLCSARAFLNPKSPVGWSICSLHEGPFCALRFRWQYTNRFRRQRRVLCEGA